MVKTASIIGILAAPKKKSSAAGDFLSQNDEFGLGTATFVRPNEV
jgi:hypothetical protein